MAIYFRGVGGGGWTKCYDQLEVPEGQRNERMRAACYWPCRTIDRWIPYMKFQPSLLLVFQEFVGYFSPFWPCKMYSWERCDHGPTRPEIEKRRRSEALGFTKTEVGKLFKFYCTQSADNQQNSIMTDILDSLCDFRRYPLIRLPKLSSSLSTIGFVFAIK